MKICRYAFHSLWIMLLTVVLLFSLYFSYLILFTPLKINDFCSERVSMLQNRPAYIERDIVVDLTTIYDMGGIATYAQEIVQYMVRARPNYRWIVLHNGEGYGNREFKEYLHNYKNTHDNLIMVDVSSKFGSVLKWIYFLEKSAIFKTVDERFARWLSEKSPKFNDTFYRFKQAFLYGKVFLDRKCDLIFSLATPAYSFSYGIPQVSVIHDVIHLDAPFAMSKTAIRASRRAFTNNFNASTKIVSISNFTKHCVMKYFANIDSDKVQVIRTQMAARLPDMADEQSDAVLTKFVLQKEKYFVFPSRFWVHKNHSGLVKAFAEMLKKYNVDHEFKLVLMGGYRNRRGKLMDTAKSVMSIADQYKIQNRVIFTGYVENDEFLAILKGALAVVNPTFYEGFGMPIAEAMLQQKPVVCSGVASLPEIGGDAALYFDPHNINDIADKLYVVYSNNNLRKKMIAKGNEQVKNFTDKEKMLENMIGLLDKIMKETKQEEKYRINWPFCYIK